MSRAIRALTLRVGGATYEQIAERMGYGDGSGARQIILRALSRREAEAVEELRLIENARLDADEQILRLIISGQQVDRDETGQPTGPRPTITERMRAVDTRTRLSARRARMNGLDAPLAVQVSAGVQADLADALQELDSVVRTVMGEVTDVHDEPHPDDADGLQT